MNVLIKSAKIIDKESPFNSKTQDILIENGKITNIASKIANPKSYKEVVFENLHVQTDGLTPVFRLENPDLKKEKLLRTDY